jgi:hypothetical protein
MRFQDIPRKIANVLRRQGGTEGDADAKGHFLQVDIRQRLGFDSNKPQHNTKEGTMTLQKIQNMAKGMGINPSRMKKADVIRGIQRKENNIDCYATDRMDSCGEDECLWRSDCLSSNNHGKAQQVRLSSR